MELKTNINAEDAKRALVITRESDFAKTNKIIYWASTMLVVLGMLPGGLGQIFHAKWSLDLIRPLGYPEYILTIIGTWKVLGSIVLLIPKLPLIKEWAYAGFFFAMSGAVISHFVSGESMNKLISPLVLLILIVLSWYFRPGDRKIISVNQ
jgi:DoxX-like family